VTRFREVRVLRKDLAILRVIDLLFQLCHPALTRQRKQVVHHLQCFQVVVAVEPDAREDPSDAPCDPHQRGKRVGRNDSSDSGAENNHQFRGLHENRNPAVFHQIAPGDRAEDDNDSEYRDHVG